MNARAIVAFGVLAVVILGAVIFFAGKNGSEVSIVPGELLAGSSTSTPPAAPSDLAATVASSTAVTLVWVDNSSNERGFQLYRSLSRTDRSQAVLAATTGPNITNFRDTGLTASTTYYYAVRAFNDFGSSSFSNVAEVLTPPGLTAPDTPSNLRATEASVATARLDWLDNSRNEDGFQIYRNTSRSTAGAVLATTTRANVTGYEDRGLNPGTSYYWAVRAFNAAGNSGFSNIASLTLTATGTLSVVDGGTPGYRLVNPGEDVELLRLRFRALGEAIDVRQLVFQLSQPTFNSPADLVGQRVNLYQASSGTQVGSAVFTGDQATSTLIAPGAFRVPAGGSLDLVVRGVINQINATSSLTASGDLLKVDYASGSGNIGIGVNSGLTIPITGGNTSVFGVRIMKSEPFLTKLSLASNSLSSGDDKVLYQFKIQSATTGPAAFYKWSFSISPNEGTAGSGSTSRYALFAYTDPTFSVPDTTISPNGLLNVGRCYNGLSDNTRPPVTDSSGQSAVGSRPGTALVEIYSQTSCAGTTTTYQIPSAQARYFRLTSTIGLLTATTSSGISANLEGDGSYPFGGLLSAFALDLISSDDDFIWSPMSFATVTPATADFYNGFGVNGLPASGLPPEVLTR